MKTLIIGLGSIILIGLIAGMFIYENRDEDTLPQYQMDTGEPEDSSNATTQTEPQQEDLWPVDGDEISYSLQNEKLHITYDKGESWVTVPVEKDKLFAGEYNGNKQSLIDTIYILTEKQAAFLYAEGTNWEAQTVGIVYSEDQGKTWEKNIVTESFPALRFRKVDFVNDQFAYVILSGGRTMSQEGTQPYISEDGGKTWTQTNTPGTTRLVSDGAFINEKTGFLSYGTINPDQPDLYVTEDAGESWEMASFQMPEKYEPVFVTAEMPVKEEDHLAILVNQGPNGDYLGGKVKGKFISKDNGKTWDFSKEVQPNE